MSSMDGMLGIVKVLACAGAAVILLNLALLGWQAILAPLFKALGQ